ncbi:hypothetical protein [Mesorhizobium sp. CN2-181]|uniref:hypothetical protein n=1 Tax=Mesorhizobium yinganensis TaxID=3157707 RepID=UPI0032B85B74
MSGIVPTTLLSPNSTAAVVLGAHDWTGIGLERAPSFLRSARHIVQHLYNPAGLGLDPELVLDLFDNAASASDQLAELQETLDQHVRERRGEGRPLTDVLLYYIGHGHPSDSGDLSLLVRRSRRNLESETGIKTADLARTLRIAAPQQRRSVILDCCFSERAAKSFIGMSANLSHQIAAVAAGNLGDNQPARGTLVLCSSGIGTASIGDPNAKHTLFTGAVLDVLQHGAEGFPSRLSFSDLRDAAFDQMLADFGASAPRPVLHQASASHGDLTRAPAFPNHASINRVVEEEQTRGNASNIAPDLPDVPQAESADRPSQESLSQPHDKSEDQSRPAIRPANDEVNTFQPEHGSELEKIEKKRTVTWRRRFTLVAVIVGSLMLLVGGYAAWRGQIEQFLTGLDITESNPPSDDPAPLPAQPAPETPASDVADAPLPAPEQEAPDQSAPPAATPTPAEPGPQKFTQRLNADGTEIDAGRAGGPTIGEGTSIASVTKPSTPSSESKEQPAPDAPAATEPTTPAQRPEASISALEQPATGGQKAILYEERTDVSEASAEPGSIVWSLVQESPGGDQPPEAAIRAEANFPGKEVQLRMTIRRNADQTLPASHIVEMIFQSPKGFEGGIDNVLRLSLKGSEQERGSPLLGIPAKIADGFFLIALNDSKQDIEANTQLLRSQGWIDIPVQYRSGRRALFTLEKGPPGTKVFDEALKAWQ